MTLQYLDKQLESTIDFSSFNCYPLEFHSKQEVEQNRLCYEEDKLAQKPETAVWIDLSNIAVASNVS